MKNQKLFLSLFVCLVAAMVAIAILTTRNRKLVDERDSYKSNTEVLSTDLERYKVNDSLSAARVRSLELTLDEFERFRAADAELIKSLKQKNRDLQSVNDVQVQTIIEMSTRPRDTVIIRDSTPISAKAVHCGDEWYDFNGLLTDNSFEGNLAVRDSLILTETVRYKRFLFWKTKRIKDRQLDCINKNPHTDILGMQYITIEH